MQNARIGKIKTYRGHFLPHGVTENIRHSLELYSKYKSLGSSTDSLRFAIKFALDHDLWDLDDKIFSGLIPLDCFDEVINYKKTLRSIVDAIQFKE